MPVPQMQHEGHKTHFGPFAFDARTEELWKNGLKLKLQGQPLKVLAILLEKPGELVTREEIRQRLWSADTFVDFEHSLNTDIKRLREALGDEAETPRYIETIRGKGYRFVGKVEWDGVQSSTASGTVPSAIEGVARKRVGWRLRRWSLAALVLLSLATAGVYILRPTTTLRIAATRRLTRTPYSKANRSLTSIVTDGSRIYFREHRNARWEISEVATAGGEVSSLPTAFAGVPHIQDISPDLSELLIADFRFGEHCCRVWLAPLPVGPPRSISNISSLFWNVSFSSWTLFAPDGRGVLYSPDGKAVYRADLDGSSPHQLMSAPNLTCPRVSPDGKRLRFTVFPDLQSTPAIWEINMDGSDARPLFSQHAPILCGVWSPDGKSYAFHQWDGSRWNLWAVREDQTVLGFGRQKPVQLTFGPLSYLPSTFSRDSKTLYTLGVDARGELISFDRNSKESTPFLPGISATFVSFSRDGQWVAYVTYPEGALWRSRIDGTERRQLTIPPLMAILPRWSPDGKLIAFYGVFGMAAMYDLRDSSIYVVPADGGTPMPLLPGFDPSWSPDGTSFAYATGCLRKAAECPEPTGISIFDLKTMRSRPISGSEGLWSPRWSPDGEQLVALSDDHNSLWRYRFDNNRWVRLASGNSFDFAAWSRDSRYVYFGGTNEDISRINVSNRQSELILSVQGIARTGWWSWFALTPDEKILLLRNIGSEDLYAFDLQAP